MPIIPPAKKPHKTYNRRYDKEKVKRLAAQGVPQCEIATLVDVHESTISMYLKKISQDKSQIQQYVSGRADALALSQLKLARISDLILSAWLADPTILLSQDVRLQKEVLVAVHGAKTYDHNAERLERGQSTENTNIILGTIQQLQDYRRRKDAGMVDISSINSDTGDGGDNQGGV